jgi:hypothetical protein
MAADGLLTLQTVTTVTSTTNGTAITVPFGIGPKPLFARVIYSAATNASGSNTVVFSVDMSIDGTNYVSSTTAPTITLTATAQANEIFIPIDFPLGAGTSAKVRLTATIAGAGSTPTITYLADVVGARP